MLQERTRDANGELGLARTFGPGESEALGILSEQSERAMVDWVTIVLHERGGAGVAGHKSQITHPIRPESLGSPDAAAAFMSRLIWEDASYHDGVVVRPAGGIPEAEAIARVSVIFDR